MIEILENQEFFDLLEPDFLGAKSEQMKLKILFVATKVGSTLNWIRVPFRKSESAFCKSNWKGKGIDIKARRNLIIKEGFRTKLDV